MASSSPSSFLSPFSHSSRSVRPSTPVHRYLPLVESSIKPVSLSLPHLEATPLDITDLPLGTPIVVLAALILAFSAQSWINSLLGGEQGLGAFLSDGTGFKKSGFKQRKRPITDDRAITGDITKPLGGPDPLPWLKLPQFDYVDVAGQPKKPKQMRQPMKEIPPPPIVRDESEVISKLESLREQMKTEVERGYFESAKATEKELKRVMKEEGYDFSA